MHFDTTLAPLPLRLTFLGEGLREPPYRVKGALTDGFDSTTKSLRTLFPGARLGICLRHALRKLPKKLAAIPSPLRKMLRTGVVA
jgi:hypothetical protein